MKKTVLAIVIVLALGCGTTGLYGKAVSDDPFGFIDVPATAVVGNGPADSPVKFFAAWDICRALILPRDATEEKKACIKSYTDRGTRYLSYHPLSSVELAGTYAELVQAYPDLPKVIFRDFNGKPDRPLGPEGLPSVGGIYNMFSNCSDIWLDFVIGMMKTQSDVGMSGVAYDEGWGTLGPGPSNDFSEPAMEGFREYLKKRYSKGELTAKGIKDILTFNWIKEIKKTKVPVRPDGNFSRQWWKKQLGRELRPGETYTQQTFRIASGWSCDEPMSALSADYSYYNRVRLQEIDSTMRRVMKAYAAEKGRDYLLASNVYNGLGWGNAAVRAVNMDIPFGELSYREESWPQRNFSAFIKNMAALGKRFCPMFWPGQCLFPKSDHDTDAWLMFAADIHACGGITQYPVEEDSPVHVDADSFYVLIQAHEEFFTEPDNRIAIYYSLGNHMGDPTQGHESLGVRTYYGAARLLEDSQLSYDVLYQGDPHLGPYGSCWVDKSVSLSDMKKYKVIVIPGTRYMTDRETRNFLGFVKDGGILVVFKEAGIGDFALKRHTNPQWRNLVDTDGVRQFGAGEVLVFADDIGDMYDASLLRTTDLWHPTRQQILQRFQSAFGNVYTSNVSTDFGRDVHVHKFRDLDKGIEVFHLINFNYDMKTDKIAPAGRADFRFLPDRPRMQPRVTYYTPKSRNGVELSVTKLPSGKLKVTIPNLHIYGVLVLSE